MSEEFKPGKLEYSVWTENNRLHVEIKNMGEIIEGQRKHIRELTGEICARENDTLSKTKAVFELICAERNRQDVKWGADRNLGPMLWMTILLEEIGETAKDILEHKNYKSELVQVAAVAVAWLEMLVNPAGDK